MKRYCLALAFVLSLSISGLAQDSKYAEVEIPKLKATPESYKNKKVTYTTTYLKFMTTFPNYIEDSGFKPEKYYLLEIRPASIPVLVKKTDELNELIPTLKNGKAVKVSGKIEKFRVEPRNKKYPRYYLALDDIEVLETEISGSATESDEDEKIDWSEGDDGGGSGGGGGGPKGPPRRGPKR